jgi:hypothetical protein
MIKNIIIISIEVILCFVFSFVFINSLKYEKIEWACFRAYYYSSGIIYIGATDECLMEVENKKDMDFLVLDYRHKDNSDMKMYDSYKLKNSKEQGEVIDILLEYENKRPSNWKRTKNSMLNEWDAHNLLYSLNYQRNRTKDVDFDNNDEDLYTKKLGIETLIKYYTRK